MTCVEISLYHYKSLFSTVHIICFLAFTFVEKFPSFHVLSDSGCELAHPGQYQGEPPVSSSFYLFNCRRIYTLLKFELLSLFSNIVGFMKGVLKAVCRFEKVLLIIISLSGHLQTNDLFPFAPETMIT